LGDIKVLDNVQIIFIITCFMGKGMWSRRSLNMDEEGIISEQNFELVVKSSAFVIP